MRNVIKALLLITLAAGLFSSLSELIFYTLGQASAYADLPRSSADKPFFDLYIWTSNLGNCTIPPWKLGGPNHCVSELYPFNYPWYPVYFLRALGFKASSHITGGLLIGFLASTSYFVMSLVLAYAALRGPEDWRKATLIVISFWVGTHTLPWRYALERGQIDLLVTGLVSASILSLFILKLKPKICWFSMICVLCLTSLIKVFPFFSALVLGFSSPKIHLSAHQRNDRIRHKSLLGVSLLLVITGILLIQPISLTSQYNLGNLGGHGFGLKTLLDAGYAGVFTFTVGWKLSLLIVGLVIGLSLIDFKSRRILGAPLILRMPDTLPELTIQVYSSMIIPIYLLTESISYKFILVSITMPCLVALDLKGTRASYVANLCFALAMCSVICVSLPFSASLYVYVEWFVHFLMHPLLFGLMSSLWLQISTHGSLVGLPDSQGSNSIRV